VAANLAAISGAVFLSRAKNPVASAGPSDVRWILRGAQDDPDAKICSRLTSNGYDIILYARIAQALLRADGNSLISATAATIIIFSTSAAPAPGICRNLLREYSPFR
jgi:hypothetical protein